ncbi:beta-lactamase class D [Agrobacterium larrymoorei]|uniref:Beta-lactamase class D n=2 Tax=Agrobacterium larrymoorei TaxID=160699 RepID=A0ABU0UKQ6_9HYPH|nr:class D beta-lactamase [Agrobacterium larrymoorei]MDQ1185536.1 beta-lactamase class D [Agrobacterium larrymoorei]
MHLSMVKTKKRTAAFIASLLVMGFSSMEAKAAEKLHCTVVLDAESGTVLHRDGTCDKAFAPQSSFKIPLAVMGYDAGILKDATNPRWNYKTEWKRPKREQKSVDPTIWERDSIVWYSQEITRRLGKAKFADYVQRFSYGNADVRGVAGQTDGLTESWLMSSLKISGDQQVDFVRRFVTGKLPVSKEAIAKTEAVIPLFSAADGWQVHGKTGSGRMRTKANTYDGDWWLGWFVGWAQKGERKVVFASLKIEDWKSQEPISFATRDALIADLPKLVK